MKNLLAVAAPSDWIRRPPQTEAHREYQGPMPIAFKIQEGGSGVGGDHKTDSMNIKAGLYRC